MDMIHPSKAKIGKELAIYLLGIFLVPAGIVLCKKSELGISPISCVLYVIETFTPLSFGTLTMLFHLANTFAQIILTKQILSRKLLLQIPLAMVFGQTIDLLQRSFSLDTFPLWLRCIALLASVAITAAGMVCMLTVGWVANPPDGAVKEIGIKAGIPFGTAKVMYDSGVVILSIILGLLFCGKILGVGIGTVVSALLTGRCTAAIMKARKREIKN